MKYGVITLSILSIISIVGLGINLCNFSTFVERNSEIWSATVQEIPSLRSSVEDPEWRGTVKKIVTVKLSRIQ